MIVWIASFPRSGNTFFRTCLHHYYGIPTYTIYEERNQDLHSLVGYKPFPDIPELDNPDETYWIKTHKWVIRNIPDRGYPAVYLARDGRDVYVSYSKFKNNDIISQINQGRRDNWGKHVKLWMNRPNTHIVKFEELIVDPLRCVEGAVKFVGLDMKRITDEDPPSFDKLSATAPDFFRRGVVGSWKDEMSPDALKAFWDCKDHAAAMHVLGY